MDPKAPEAMMRPLLTRYPVLAPLAEALALAERLLLRTAQAGCKILVCGNGGSAADAEHIVGELMKGFCLSRPLTPVQRQALSDAFPEEGPALADSLQQAVPVESTGHPGIAPARLPRSVRGS
jgi:D-sedoheptulose 7-phosphate isomerase